jgi:hypothetical protein
MTRGASTSPARRIDLPQEGSLTGALTLFCGVSNFANGSKYVK